MLLSLTLILFCGFALGGIFRRMKLPALLGMMLTGIVLGPHILNAIHPTLLELSPILRQVALIVILIRAGLSLNLKDLKKVGRPALLLCFIPATFELVAVTLFAPALLGISRLEAAIMGTVLAAVSPAVVVPRMLQLMEQGYGTDQNIPQMIMAGASLDDVYVIVLFTSFLGIEQGKNFALSSLIQVPVSMILGLVSGVLVGMGMVWLFRHFHMRDTIKVLLLLGASFLLVSLESILQNILPLSGLLAVMALGATILQQYPPLAKRLAGKYNKLWVAAELLLFVLVGDAVDITYLRHVGIAAICLILLALLCRSIGVFVSLLGTSFTLKERLFTTIAYLPKATVQAAIGGVPLAMGLPAGALILSVAVLAILIAAPLGAIGMDSTYRQLLQPAHTEPSAPLPYAKQ